MKLISVSENRTPSVAITGIMFLGCSVSTAVITSDYKAACNPLSVYKHIVYTCVRWGINKLFLLVAYLHSSSSAFSCSINATIATGFWFFLTNMDNKQE